MGGGCHPENFYKFVVHKTESRKYPFSGIGLVRENPNDTIEIFYSNATEQEGVNEVLTAKFATDTVVGMNESWVNIDFGSQYGSEEIVFSPPNYSENGGQYFEICNLGKSNIFYFILPNPQGYKRFYFEKEDESNSEVLYKYYIVDYLTKKSIYEILFPKGAYDVSFLNYIKQQFKNHDETGRNLFYVTEKNISEEKLRNTGSYMLSRTTEEFNLEDTTKVNGKAFFYGIVYPNECMLNSKYKGGMMLQLNAGRCYDDKGVDC